jgi:hypothetical protein
LIRRQQQPYHESFALYLLHYQPDLQCELDPLGVRGRLRTGVVFGLLLRLPWLQYVLAAPRDFLVGREFDLGLQGLCGPGVLGQWVGDLVVDAGGLCGRVVLGHHRWDPGRAWLFGQRVGPNSFPRELPV